MLPFWLLYKVLCIASDALTVASELLLLTALLTINTPLYLFKALVQAPYECVSGRHQYGRLFEIHRQCAVPPPPSAPQAHP